MKREIKFRAWDKGTKDMFEGVDFHELIHWEEWELETTDGESSLPRNDADFEDLIWMQCTGLKDKNGKEIYEGDIVKTEHNTIGIVAWFNEEAKFGIDYQIKKIRRHTIYGLSGEYEVIGNIFENPDLIKEEKK